jgi:hypothetical protein
MAFFPRGSPLARGLVPFYRQPERPHCVSRKRLATGHLTNGRSKMSTRPTPWLSAVAAAACLWTAATHDAAAEDTIKIGILHSLSGTMAISETILKDLMLMQVEEVNAKGGLLGKKRRHAR